MFSTNVFMVSFIIIILLSVTAIAMVVLRRRRRRRDGHRGVALLESFFAAPKHEEQVEYVRLLSKLSNKAVQPYKGDIDSTLTVNKTRDANYYPQLWLFSPQSGHLKNVGTGRYLTVSPDRTKVILAPLNNKKKNKDHPDQQWHFDASTGFVTNRANLALHLEGGNNQEDAMVVVTRKGEGAAFQWYMEKVAVNIRHTVLLGGTLSGKTEHVVTKKVPKAHSATYSLWVNVGGMDYKKGELKNIFKQGPHNTPGLYISPTENRFQVLWDQQESVVTRKFTFELDTWYHLALVLINQSKLQIYIDGQVTEEFAYNNAPSNLNLKSESNSTSTIVFGVQGGFDGSVSNAEYTNKALTIAEIGQRMSATNPQPACREQQRVPTKVPGNLSKDPLDQWAISKNITHVKKNTLCPPNTLGGTTLSFRSGTGGTVSTRLTLLDNQYYEVSVWALSSGLNLRPYYKSRWNSAPVWTGEWQLAPVAKPPRWQEYKWAFATSSGEGGSESGGGGGGGGEFGFDINTKERQENGLFLPVVSLKIMAAAAAATGEANVVVKEYRSNGTHNTCSIAAADIGLNATGGWCALKDSRDEYYVEANFDNLYHIDKIHTRGRGDYPQWTTEYRLEYYDVYYSQWRKYGGTFEGNTDMHTVKTNRVSLLTDKIRLYAVSFQSWPALRLAFSGSIGLKDKCTEYKIKGAHDLNLAERARNTQLYDKECKKVSYDEYKTLRDQQQPGEQATKAQLEKLQIDVAMCHQRAQANEAQLAACQRLNINNNNNNNNNNNTKAPSKKSNARKATKIMTHQKRPSKKTKTKHSKKTKTKKSLKRRI